MTTQEIITGLQNVLDYCRYHQDAPALREAIEMLKCSEIPNSSDERTDKRTGTHACDCISRQQAIDVARKCSVKEVTPAYMLIDKAEVMTDLMMLPSAQPKLPDWVQKVEEYRKSAPSYVQKPLAWALYQVWKEFDR